MKVLFDENLSQRLAELLAGEYPGSVHVRGVDLRGADDARIWEHARSEGFAIASKDGDFRQRSFLQGAPPKVIWLAVGNAGTQAIADLLRRERSRVDAFDRNSEASLLVLAIEDGAA